MRRLALASALLLGAALATGCGLDVGARRIGGSFPSSGSDVQYYPPELKPEPVEKAAAMKPMAIQTSESD